MSDDTSKKAIVLPLSHNAHGAVRGLVLDENGIRGAEFTPLADGKPIMGEYVELKGREGSPLVNASFHKLPHGVVPTPPHEEQRSGGERRGPARVNSRAYTENYDRIFRKAPVGEA